MPSADRLRSVIEENRDLAFELVRIYLGVGLFAKGVYFATHIDDALTLVEAGQLQTGAVIIAHYVVLAHLAGGFMLVIGLLTRIGAWAQVPILAGAVFVVHLREGFFGQAQNLEFAILVLFLLVLVGVHGGGRLSVDARLFAEAEHPASPESGETDSATVDEAAHAETEGAEQSPA